MASPDAFLSAGRRLPGWVLAPALAFTLAGAPELLGAAALGAAMGWSCAAAFLLGFVPAVWIAARSMSARFARASVQNGPELLGCRFGGKGQWIASLALLAVSVSGAAVALAVVARAAMAMHCFDALVRGRGWTVASIYPGVVMGAAMVALLAYLWGGFAASVYGRAIQFCFLLAGLVPFSVQAVAGVGGWSGLAAAGANASVAGWAVAAGAGSSRWNVAGWSGPLGWAFLLGAGVVAGLISGSADPRLHALFGLLAPRARGNPRAARPVPAGSIALPGGAILLLGLLLVAAAMGAAAALAPTPQTTVRESMIEGAIVRTTTVARPEEAAGHGLVPAMMDASDSRLVTGQGGKPRLDYALALPKLGSGLLATEAGQRALGLFLAALLAALLASVSAHLAAATQLLVQVVPWRLRRGPESAEGRLRLTRWLAVAALAPAAALALLLAHHGASSTSLLAAWAVAWVLMLAPLSLAQRAVSAATRGARR